MVQPSSKQNWGVKKRILALLGFAVTVFAGMAYYSLNQVNRISDDVTLLGGSRIPIAEVLGDLRSASNGLPRFMWLALANSGRWSDREKAIQKVVENLELMEKSVEKLEKAVLTTEVKSKIEEIKPLLAKLRPGIEGAIVLLKKDNVKVDVEAKQFLLTQMPPHAVKITSLTGEIAVLVKKKNEEIVNLSNETAKRATTTMVLVSLVAGALLLLFGGILAAKLAKSLLEITKHVRDSAGQVAAASSQLSHSSEQLSSTAQEQASAIEETSASLTEISGMVEANTKSADHSNDLAKEVFNICEGTRQSMGELTSAMKLILEANRRIEALVKIIEEIGEKTEVIDEIVFKTQLLSFNASVEAERAGEHGRGFAVVAQEVGNLAQMSGKAATEISSIVKTSIKEAVDVSHENKSRVEKGGNLAESTRSKMDDVVQRMSQILDASSKIAAASREQTQGVGQISTSVESLNQATQLTASTAEEAASASQELSSQAASMLSLVGELEQIVTGAVSQSGHIALTSDPAEDRASRPTAKVVEMPKQTSKQVSAQRGAGHTQGRAARASAPRFAQEKKVAGDTVTTLPADEWEKL